MYFRLSVRGLYGFLAATNKNVIMHDTRCDPVNNPRQWLNETAVGSERDWVTVCAHLASRLQPEWETHGPGFEPPIQSALLAEFKQLCEQRYEHARSSLCYDRNWFKGAAFIADTDVFYRWTHTRYDNTPAGNEQLKALTKLTNDSYDNLTEADKKQLRMLVAEFELNCAHLTRHHLNGITKVTAMLKDALSSRRVCEYATVYELAYGHSSQAIGTQQIAATLDNKLYNTYLAGEADNPLSYYLNDDHALPPAKTQLGDDWAAVLQHCRQQNIDTTTTLTPTVGSRLAFTPRTPTTASSADVGVLMGGSNG